MNKISVGTVIISVLITIAVLLIINAPDQENKRRDEYIGTCQSETGHSERYCIWMYEHDR